MPIIKYKIKILDDTDNDALELFISKCDELGIKNNNSRKILKIDEPTTKFWVTYYIPTNEIISMSGMHRFPLSLEAWNGLIENCWRIGLRQATLPEHRAKFSVGLKNNLQNSFQFGDVFPLQIREAQKYNAEKIICTTNTSKNTQDCTGKLFQMDRVAHILNNKGYSTKVGENIKILGYYQNVWELNVEKWGC